MSTEYERKDLKGAGKESSMGERRSGNGWPHGGMEREGGGGGKEGTPHTKRGGGHAERCMRTQEENIERGGASVRVSTRALKGCDLRPGGAEGTTQVARRRSTGRAKDRKLVEWGLKEGVY